MLASMARGDELPSLMTRVQSGCRAAHELGAVAVFIVALALFVLTMLGLAVRDLSTAVGHRCPTFMTTPTGSNGEGSPNSSGTGSPLPSRSPRSTRLRSARYRRRLVAILTG